MRRIPFFITFCFLSIAFAACNNSGTSEEKNNGDTTSKATEPDNGVSRGAYLVNAIGCNDCHSPKNFTAEGPVIDSSKILSGHPANSPLPPFDASALKPGNWIQMAPDLTAYVGPWGITYAPNLTPDSATGIGAWSQDVFVKAMRTGKHMGLASERPILPPMPWEEIGKLNDNDLKAIFAYLHSLHPVSNKVPPPASPEEAAKLAKK